MFENLPKEYKVLWNKALNPREVKIIKLLKKEKLTISELSRKGKMPYSEAHRYVRELEKLKLVKTKKEMKEKHHPVYVSLIS